MAGVFHTLVYPIGPGAWRSDLALPPMAPGSERTYLFDLSAFCDDAAAGGTTITSVAPLVDQSLSLALVQPASGAKTVTFTLAGGIAAIPAPVLYLEIVLANGDIEQVTITQQIAMLSPAIPYPSTPTGSPLTVGFHPIDVSTLAQLAGGAQPGDAVVAVRNGTPGLVSAVAGGSSGLVTLTAGATISGHRVLMPTPAGTVVHADPTALGYQFGGISTQAVVAGAPVLVGQAGALIVEPSWAWTPGVALFVAAGGLLTAVPPTSGISQQVAVATAATTVLVQPFAPIRLS